MLRLWWILRWGTRAVTVPVARVLDARRWNALTRAWRKIP